VTDDELAELYATCKQLIAAFAAGVMTGAGEADLPGAAAQLHARSARAAERHEAGPLRDQFRACVEAAAGLRAALDESRTTPTAETIGRLRALHRSLRRRVWDTMGCEYVPCAAGAILAGAPDPGAGTPSGG
jgi:hypothetical protein